MIVRDATPADHATLLSLFESMAWDRPWPRPALTEELFEGKVVLVAEEDGELLGFAFGEPALYRRAHLNVAYVRPERRRQGVTKALLAEFAARARAAGSEYMTLDVDTSNELGQRVWQRLGFADYARRLSSSIDALEARLEAREAAESYASLHVQTDDVEAVEAAVAKYLPRLGGSGGRTVGPRNGWVAVYAELIDRDRRARERLAAELSQATSAVVCAIGVEDGAIVRYALFERGSIVDEYQSVPEYFGSLPPGDVVALGANPTVVARLTGAQPARVRAVARTAASPAALPPAPELLAALAEVMGLQGAGRE
jgi:ribosomal protein S18 acetylase RimI-like enzyme